MLRVGACIVFAPGSHSRQGGEVPVSVSQQLHRGGQQYRPDDVASSRTATASPTPACLRSRELAVANSENTPNITGTALVTTPAVRGDAVAHGLIVEHAAVDSLAHPGCGPTRVGPIELVDEFSVHSPSNGSAAKESDRSYPSPPSPHRRADATAPAPLRPPTGSERTPPPSARPRPPGAERHHHQHPASPRSAPDAGASNRGVAVATLVVEVVSRRVLGRRACRPRGWLPCSDVRRQFRSSRRCGRY